MDFDPRLVIATAIIVTVVLWAIPIALRRVDGRVTARGFRNGGLIAALLFLITALIVAFVFNGRAVFLVTLDQAGAIGLGLLVGAVVALGYMWLGGVLIAIGLIFKSKPQWTTLGAWAAVPVIVVSAGFGYVSFRSVASEGATTSTANGHLSLALSGAAGRISAEGAATCAIDQSGTLTVEPGIAADPHVISIDGRLISARITMNPAITDAGLELSIERLDTSGVSVTAIQGKGAAAGQLTLSASAWTGTLGWSCDQL